MTGASDALGAPGALGAFEDFVRTGRAVDLVLAVIALEFLVLTFRPGAKRGAGPVLDRLLALGPGIFILLALRAALRADPLPLVAAFLAVSFPVHLADVLRRRL